MYKKPQKTLLSHYLRTGQKIDGFQPDSYKSYDLCDLCGGTIYDLDIKGILSERNARYRTLFQNYETAKRAGKTHKIWQISSGSTTRQSHKDANWQKVGIDEKFRVGGEELFLPNDPKASLSETANCRCSVRYVGENAVNISEEDDIRRRTEQEGELQAEIQALHDKLDALVASAHQNPRAVAARRRLHELDPKKHHEVNSGVSIPATIVQKISLIADEYYILTGEDILVTSGARSPAKQALEMYNNRVRRGKFQNYKEVELLKEIKKAYDYGAAANRTRSQIIRDMANVIQAQVTRGKFISKHLNDRAVDIRSKSMSLQQRNAFWVAAKKVASKVLLENNPDHWHVQF